MVDFTASTASEKVRRPNTAPMMPASSAPSAVRIPCSPSDTPSRSLTRSSFRAKTRLAPRLAATQAQKTGIATPTEVGALGALLAGIIGAVFGRLTLADALDAVKSTIRTSAMIFLILIGATIFGYYMALSRIPQDMVSAVTAMDLNRWVVIIGIVVAYFIISMFMDEIPLLLLTLQLTFPLITSLGFDPIWFGVMSMMMVAMGLVFPPVGLIAFIVSATAGVDLMKVYKGTSILMISMVITTVLLMIFPQIALWLPATMR